MMLIFLAALVVALARGMDMSCGCFASQGAGDDPISWMTVVRDLFWLGLSVLVLARDDGLAGLDRVIERRHLHA